MKRTKTSLSLAAKKAWATRRASKSHSQKNRPINLKAGTDAHRLVVRLLHLGVCSCVLEKATGLPSHTIAAIKAHISMGTYKAG